MGARTLSKKTGPRQRVLCFAGANREKGDRTPWEWKGRDPDWWAASRSGSSMRGEWLEQPDDFYFRAGALLDWPKETRFKDEDCSSSSPAALYGCGNGIDGAPLSSLGDFEARAGFELGVGYAAACAGSELRVVLPSVSKVLVVRRVHARAQDLWDRHVVRAGPCAASSCPSITPSGRPTARPTNWAGDLSV